MKARVIPMVVLDPKETEGMTAEEKRAYYIRKFRMGEAARLVAARGE